MINILYLHAGAEMYGADKVLLDLVRHLDRTKYHASVLLPCDGILARSLRESDIDVEVLPYPILRRKYFTPRGMVEYARSLAHYTDVLSEYCMQHKIDLIHSNTAAVLEGAFVAKRLSLPLVWSIHEIILKPRIVCKLTSWIVSRYSSKVVVDSEAVKSHLEHTDYFGNNPISVIYNGVDASHFSPNLDTIGLRREFEIPDNARIVGMVGRVNAWKGQMDFLEAAEKVMSEMDDVYAVLVGSSFEGEEWREVELASRIIDSPFRERILQKGYRNDSREIYNLFDVFVLPSTNPDPLPTVVLENMACGNPIVSYRHGGVCEMVEEGVNGFFAHVGDTDDMAEKIKELLRNPALRHRFGLASRERLLQEFSLESYIENIAAVYDEIINECSQSLSFSQGGYVH